MRAGPLPVEIQASAIRLAALVLNIQLRVAARVHEGGPQPLGLIGFHPLAAHVRVEQATRPQCDVANHLGVQPVAGAPSQQPTHPKLLDWLAVELHDSGWDLKHILRLMVTSQTFRQSSAWRDDLDDDVPDEQGVDEDEVDDDRADENAADEDDSEPDEPNR